KKITLNELKNYVVYFKEKYNIETWRTYFYNSFETSIDTKFPENKKDLTNFPKVYNINFKNTGDSYKAIFYKHDTLMYSVQVPVPMSLGATSRYSSFAFDASDNYFDVGQYRIFVAPDLKRLYRKINVDSIVSFEGYKRYNYFYLLILDKDNQNNAKMLYWNADNLYIIYSASSDTGMYLPARTIKYCFMNALEKFEKSDYAIYIPSTSLMNMLRFFISALPNKLRADTSFDIYYSYTPNILGETSTKSRALFYLQSFKNNLSVKIGYSYALKFQLNYEDIIKLDENNYSLFWSMKV
ncbi:MAG: hypothetical protein NZM44_04395, partial [Candidatus Calescibacterium sp.]|nr:hypothetical protein [Candidatus Calescibacterium sp.]